jgi:hypothetical protein
MIDSVITIGGHLTKRILCDLTGAPITLAEFYPDLYQFRLKIIDTSPDGTTQIQVYPNVTSLTASIGLIYAQPRAGTFGLTYGTTATTPIDIAESPDDFKTALALLPESTTYGLDVVYSPTPSTWVMRFLTPPTDPIPLVVASGSNELEPETFVRVRQFTQNAETWVEVRLLQGPIASTNANQSILPPAPTVTEIRRGFTEDDIIEVIKVNEIQAIYVPPDFNGTYIINFQGRQTSALSANSGAQDIQNALNFMYNDTIIRFTVTNPIPNNAYVEFVGPFSGMPEDLLTITAQLDPTKVDLFFQLDLNTTEVAEALRANSSVAAEFELRLHITDPTIVPPAPPDPGQDVVLFQETVTIARGLHWEGLEAAAPIHWLYPPNPKDYVPFTMDQIIRGTITYSAPFGDGISNAYSIAHDLNSDAINVEVRENTSNGRLLRDDEYTVNFVDANGLTITIPGTPPATNSLLAMIFSVGPIDMFLAHTHTIAQIIGLQDVINGILTRLSNLEAILPGIIGLIPGVSPFGTDPNAQLVSITVPDRFSIVPTNRDFTGKSIDLTKPLPPEGLLLPAIHNVIELGTFTVDTTANTIILDTPYPGTPALVNGQRARIDQPQFYTVGPCTFDHTTDTITYTGTPTLANGRRVKFSGGTLPSGLSVLGTYYVINATSGTFQVSLTLGGPVNPLIDNGDTATHDVSTVSEIPGGLLDSVDYFMLAPTSTTFHLSTVIGGPPIDITTAGIPTFSISTIAEDPSTAGILPAPGPLYAGKAYSVRQDIFLRGGRGIPSETVHPMDIIACDGRVWYHVTRSDVPGSNSFYPTAMEIEIFRIALNETMLAAGSLFTITFNLGLQMFKQDCNVQYLLMVEIAEMPEDVAPTPTGPNLFDVVWNKTPLLQQRIIVTDVLVTAPFGAQILHQADGTFSTNKKLYGVEIAGDVIPSDANCALRVRLAEFDTEDNIADASGLIYYTISTVNAGVSTSTPAPPATTTPLP